MCFILSSQLPSTLFPVTAGSCLLPAMINPWYTMPVQHKTADKVIIVREVDHLTARYFPQELMEISTKLYMNRQLLLMKNFPFLFIVYLRLYIVSPFGYCYIVCKYCCICFAAKYEHVWAAFEEKYHNTQYIAYLDVAKKTVGVLVLRIYHRAPS